MAGFPDNNASQGSVATNARCSEIFNIHLTKKIPRNLPMKKTFYLKWLRFDRILVMSLWPQFFGPTREQFVKGITKTKIMPLNLSY